MYVCMYVCMLVSCDRKPIKYIAHAGGRIDGYTYTNSLEAVNHAIECGIEVVELDLCLTKDSVLVAAHDWPHFHKISGYVGDTMPIMAADFCNRRIFGKYHPLTKEMIDSLMQQYPSLCLMTDKISDPNVLCQFQYRERIMVEAFSIDDYYKLDTMGYYKVFYSASPKSYQSVLKKWTKRVLHIKNEPIPTRYTFWLLGCGHGERIRDYYWGYGKEFAVFGVKNRHEADSIAALDRRIKYVYIDDVK